MYNSQGSVAAGQLSGFGEESSAVARYAMNRFSAGTTVRYDRLIYPATLSYMPNYATSVQKGVARLKVQVDYFVRNCPSTKIVLIGYAEGAHVVHLAAAALGPNAASHISSVVLMADLIRNVSNTSGTVRFNFGASLGSYGNGSKGRGPAFTNGLQKGPRVVSFCGRYDGYCNSKNAIAQSSTDYRQRVTVTDMGGYLWTRLYQAGVR